MSRQIRSLAGMQHKYLSSDVQIVLVYRPCVDNAIHPHTFIVWHVDAAEKNKEKAAAKKSAEPKKRKAEPASNAKKKAAAK